MKQSPKLPAEKRRAQLIKAAMKVISKKGYAGATTDAIARQAGLTKGALYFHFGSKEDIFFAVVKEISKRHFTLLTGPLLEETDPEKGLEKMIRNALGLVAGHKYFTLDFWQQANRVKKIRDYLEMQHNKLEKELVNYLKKHFAMKKRESQTLYLLLHILFDGVVVRNQSCSSSVNLKRLQKDVIEMTKLFLHRK